MNEARTTSQAVLPAGLPAGLPDDLEVTPPGPGLGALLATVQRADLDGRDRLRLARARNRQVSYEQAQLMADLYACTWQEPPEDGPVHRQQASRYPWAESEVAFALTWTTFAAGNRLEQARQLIEDLPAVQTALAAGEIDMPKALLICDEVALVDVAVARAVVDKVIDTACRLTTGQLRARLRRLLLAADPEAVNRKATEQVKGRRVQAFLNDSNLAALTGYELAPHRVAAAWERLNAIARAAKAGGDERRLDQLRADAFLDLLVGEGVAGGGPITDGGLGAVGGDGAGGGVSLVGAEAAVNATAIGVRRVRGTADRAPREPDDPDTGPAVAEVGAGELPPDPDGAVCLWAGQEDGLDEPPDMIDGSLLDSDPVIDTEQAELHAMWLAGFASLPTTRPTRCHCVPGSATSGSATSGSALAGGALPAPRKGVVDLQIPLTTLIGLSRLPGELDGFGPVVADIARQVAIEQRDATWRFSAYNQRGELVHHGITRARPATAPAGGIDHRRTPRRPSAEIAAFVRARDRTCVAPGCRRAARDCDIDHTIDWALGGESDTGNLGMLCRAHHLFKHADGSTLQQLSPGVFTWETPRRLQYVTRPEPPLISDADLQDLPPRAGTATRRDTGTMVGTG